MGKNKDWWDGAYNQRTGGYDLGKDVSDSAKKNGGVGWDGGSFDSWSAAGTEKKKVYGKDGQVRYMDMPANPKKAKQQDMLRQAGIDSNEAYHLAHAAGITNVNSKSDIKAIVRAKDQSNTSEAELEAALKGYSKSGKDKGEGDEEPYAPREKSEEHQAAEEAYGDGAYPETTSATDSYNAAFNAAAEAGQELTAGDYLRQRSDDKKGWITNRFMPWLDNKNELARYEQQHAASTAIDRAVEAGVEAPSLNDPMDMYDQMKDDIEDIG